jgi:hypothetical protein
MNTALRVMILAALGLFIPFSLQAQSTAFTYQGQLKDGSSPANGTYDLSVSICTAASGGVTSTPIYVDDLMVTDGLFTAELDFDSSWFNGSDRWLEISVRPGSASNADRSGYTLLAPRQKITPGPYALHSRDSARLGGQTPASFAPASHSHDAGAIVSGELPDARVSNALTISDSGSVDGGAIKTGTISQARIDSAIARDTEVSDEIEIHSSYSDAHHTWPLTDAEIPNDITISSSGSVDGGAIKSGTVADARIASTITRDNEVMTIVLANDGAGSGLDADLLDGQHASAFMPAATDNWVNTTGDTMTGSLNITGTDVYLRVTRSSSGGIAVRGTSPSYGGYFEASSDTGRGIYCKASSSSGTTYGGYFEASSDSGCAIYGNASSSSGETYGGRFDVSSTNGCAIFGLAGAGSGVNYGVKGHTNSSTGYAAYFTGIAGSTNYFLRKVGIGSTALTNMLEVYGNASKNTAGDWLANSDARIKTDVRTVSSALDTLARVRLVEFEYTEEYLAEHPEIEDRRYMNVIAQEFAKVFPDYVQGSGEKLPDGGEILQVDTHPITIYTAAAVQELHAEFKQLQDTNKNLKEELSAQQRKTASLEARLAALEAVMQKQ